MNVQKMLKRLEQGNLPYYRKELLFFKKKIKKADTIVNIPISVVQHRGGKFSMKILWDEAEVQATGNISKGWHTEYTIVLPARRRRGLIMRKVLA